MIGGLVVYLAQDDSLAQQATSAMREQPGLDLGEQTGRRLPAVVESMESQTVEETTDWIRNLPGVVHVDVVFVHLEEELLSEEQGTLVPLRTTFRNAE
jgi:nitrate reductase NapAB chaperone NapD